MATQRIYGCKQCGKPTPASTLKRGGGYCAEHALLTQTEAIAALRVSKGTFHRWIKAGKIEQRRISAGRVLVPRSEVDAVLAGERF